MLDIVSYDVKFPKGELGKRARFWFNRFLDMAISFRKWPELPDTINRDYLEVILNTQGSVVWTKDGEGNLRALMSSVYGFDCYNFPTSYLISNPVLGELKGELGINGVWMRNNRWATPSLDLIREFAIQMAEIDVDVKINLDNMKSTTVFNVPNVEMAKQVRELYCKIVNGEPAVVTNQGNDIFDDENMNVFNSNISYIVDKLLADRRTILNDFLTQFGVNNVTTEKKERLITSEVDSNNQELSIMSSYWLDPVNEAIKEINRIFGTEIEPCTIVRPDEDTLDDFVNGGGSDELRTSEGS